MEPSAKPDFRLAREEFLIEDSFMRTLLAPLVFVTFLVGIPPVWAATGGAYDAIEAARKGSAGSRLVEVTAERGDPNPQQWTIVFADPAARGGIREVTVAGVSVVSERTPLRGYPEASTLPSINVSRMNLDSIGAFDAANREARKRQLGFDWVDYKLKPGGPDSTPVWQVTLFDHMGAKVGVIEVSAYDGSIVSPLHVAAQPRSDESTTRFSDSGTGKRIGGVMGAVGGIVEGTALKARDVTLRTAGTVQEILTGERTIGPTDDDD